MAGRGREAARLCPAGAVCRVVDWPLPPEDADGVRPEVVEALSRALAACGAVAFRCEEGEPSVPAPRRTVREWAMGVLGLGGDVFDVAVASGAEAVAGMFAYGGWGYSAGAAIVFDPAAEQRPIVAALGRDRDWRRAGLPAGARLLFGAGHDGAFGVVAAADAVWLGRFRAAIR